MNPLEELLGQILGELSGLATVEPVRVTAFTAGIVHVSWRGSDIKAARLDSYGSPAVGDWVLLAHHADTPYILGRLIGAPT